MKNPDLYGLSLASRLCSIVNDHALSSVDTVLADYLLDHYHELDALKPKPARFPAAAFTASASSWGMPTSAI